MRIFLTILLFLFFVSQTNSQTNTEKIDSVFKFYFFIFEMETTNCCPPQKYPDYYDSIVIQKTNDTVYLNKYASEAVEFIQKISKIKAPIWSYHNDKPVVFSINPETVDKWKDWYLTNRHRIKWSDKENRPVLK
jgi:hypothetical protein